MSTPPTSPAPSVTGPPPEVRAAVWLWVGAIVVGIVSAVVSVVVVDDAVRELVRTELAATPALASFSSDDLVRLVSILGLVLSVLWAGVKLALVLLVRSGRGWARTALTVVGALGVTSALLGLRVAPVAEGVLGLVGAALVVAAGVAMYSGDANPYLAPRPPRSRPRETPPG